MARVEGLLRALGARGTAWAGPVEWRESVTSTNDLVKEEARRGAPEWSTLLADRQTGGRGRSGRAWASPAGGLYVSVLLRPFLAAASLLPLAAGVAVTEGVAEHGVAAELKWPNDVLARGRKLGGILAEASSAPGGVEWVVVGIGVNVRVVPEALGSELPDGATSIAVEGGATATVEGVAASVLARLGVWYDRLHSRPASVVEAWRSHAVRWWGAPVEIRTSSEVVRGRLRDVDEAGALLVDLDNGRTRRVLSGEVARVRAVGVPDR
jgi:BirA family transcriptional regulator, biotin operon repressor / biotin---[acetyl-CoA-carboxylase] ligase